LTTTIQRGCRIPEENIGVDKPYDLVVECPDVNEPVRLYVEVKSHLKRILVAELTDSETRFAEANPYNYIVCSVMGLEAWKVASWTAIRVVYANYQRQ
jgi:hypothetical protein